MIDEPGSGGETRQKDQEDAETRRTDSEAQSAQYP